VGTPLQETPPCWWGKNPGGGPPLEGTPLAPTKNEAHTTMPGETRMCGSGKKRKKNPPKKSALRFVSQNPKKSGGKNKRWCSPRKPSRWKKNEGATRRMGHFGWIDTLDNRGESPEKNGDIRKNPNPSLASRWENPNFWAKIFGEKNLNRKKLNPG